MVRPHDRKFITADPEKCTGCLVCEYVCSMANEKTFNPTKSRIRAMRLDPVTNLAISCRHCEHPACVAACPRNALTQEEATGIIRVNEEICNGCGWCINACQFGAITVHPGKRVVFLCNNCTENDEKEPQCVKWCPNDALTVVNAETLAQRGRNKAVKHLFDAATKNSQ
ncbi:MAG: 4Fe-4S dicluster domain-containing protein [Candidatus Bathyarchaeota archaeon]|nr:4Fe-4S dicluster domain-containing protein [Candidatus Bathyarchaeota archaeon]